MMRTDEVGGDVAGGAEAEEIGHPGVIRSGWAAYLEPVIHSFDRLRGVLVKLEIMRLASSPEAFEVRFIPDLEEPMPKFLDAVAFGPVADQPVDQCFPLRVIPGRRHISFISEDSRVAGR